MDKTILHDKIYYYENVIEDFDNFNKVFKKMDDGWTVWHSSDNEEHIYGEHKSLDLKIIDEAEGHLKENMLYIYNLIMNAFRNVAKDYAESQDEHEEPKLFDLLNIKKYNAGTYMGSHFDQLQGDMSLKYSFVMYLNDNYEGGELSFNIIDYDEVFNEGPHIDTDYDKASELKLFDIGFKPKSNSVVIFPASAPYFHTAHLVKTGFKYMITSHWIHNDYK